VSDESKKRDKYRAARRRRERAREREVIELAVVRTLGIALNLLAEIRKTERAVAIAPKDAA
jgi:hypothetical protein